jgi:murein DD-endopeptidase MepM/ murein hydrolase activator NlpD
MKTILTILFTMSFFGNAFAIECWLPLCAKISRSNQVFKGIDNYKFPKYDFSKMKKNSHRKIKKITFEPSKPIKKKTRKKLLWPLKRGRITSKFGYRNSPFTGHKQHHNGLDISAPSGTRIRAVASGVVTKSGWMSNGCGYGVHIKHSNYETVYCHASRVFVVKGEQIKRGQGIARVGSTGRSTGPHLHFEIRSLKTKKSYNPLKYLG